MIELTLMCNSDPYFELGSAQLHKQDLCGYMQELGIKHRWRGNSYLEIDSEDYYLQFKVTYYGSDN